MGRGHISGGAYYNPILSPRVSTLETKMATLHKQVHFSVTLSTSGWNKNSTWSSAFWWQDFTVTGLQATDKILPLLNHSNSESIRFQHRQAWKHIEDFVPLDNKLRVYCGEDGAITYELPLIIVTFRSV